MFPIGYDFYGQASQYHVYSQSVFKCLFSIVSYSIINFDSASR